MSKYHVNWVTGNPQACLRSDCDEDFHSEHYVTVSRYYEDSMSKYVLPPTWSKGRRPPN